MVGLESTNTKSIQFKIMTNCTPCKNLLSVAIASNITVTDCHMVWLVHKSYRAHLHVPSFVHDSAAYPRLLNLDPLQSSSGWSLNTPGYVEFWPFSLCLFPALVLMGDQSTFLARRHLGSFQANLKQNICNGLQHTLWGVNTAEH